MFPNLLGCRWIGKPHSADVTQTLHIITGPTAVGKTEYALAYTEAHHAEIISCDASLFYRGMDIGTAKPTITERQRVPHHLIDICDVDEPFDIVAYDRAARAAVDTTVARGRSVVVTGGSGFYLKSFLAPVVDSVVVPETVRGQVEEIYAESGLSGLLLKLRELSPDTGNLDLQNPRRVLRALERVLASGKTLPELQAEFAARPKPYPEFTKKIILLERDTSDLKDRVYRRARAMLDQGLLSEVEDLLARGIERNPSAAAAIGYRETIACLKGEISEGQLCDEIAFNTMRLVKKQRTWFRTQIPEPDQRICF